ncbi:protein transport protein Sec16A isoform X10 [Cavia porcellus]|uniref:protein transport protein Sec16A isoform X10 n=1 Tax=Cavia porcellus TaxID=10141 RepID=UPI000350850C|nr:protein transport protein Sec16A isoform X9 [Cavia porcellus]
MQPPSQGVVPGVAGPPPAGTPRSMFWGSSGYRKLASSSAPVAPPCSLQPVTDPFAFSRQMRQNNPLDALSRSSLPASNDPALPVFSQWPGLPVPQVSARESTQGPPEPLAGPLSQPNADQFSGASVPPTLPGHEMGQSAEVSSSSGPEVLTAPLHPAHYIPGDGADQSSGGQRHGSGPDQALSRHALRDSVVAPAAVAAAASSFFSQPRPRMPAQWGPAQGSLQPSQQGHSPSPEGPVQSVGPQATSTHHFPASSSLHHSPGYELHAQLVSPPAPLASGRGSEVAPLQSGNHSVGDFHHENSFGHNPRIGNMWESQEFMQNPGVKEHFQDPAPGNSLTQGNSPENQVHYPSGAGSNQAPTETASGALSMFFQGEETENEENLSSEKAESAGCLDLDGFSPSPGPGHSLRPVHGAGIVHQAFPPGSHSETTQQKGGTQPYFSQSAGFQSDNQTTNSAAGDAWGDTAGLCDAGGSQYENVENLEFIQNQEVLPAEPLILDAPSPNDQFRYGLLPGPPVSRHGTIGVTRGGALNLEAPDTPVHPVRSDSMSSSYSGQSHRSLSGSARSQEPVGTFIQQEVGKPEEDATGSFFKQIYSSPVGGDSEEISGSQNYYSTLSQPSTPSPPKPTGTFQASANSSFEPVKSHSVEVKPVEVDQANMVGEVRGTHEQAKKCRPVAVPPNASPGNLEQPPDNMETLFAPQACSPPLPPTVEAIHTAAPPLDTVRSTPEKRPFARAQGSVKCESPATTLWAQNELPDFGGNVLLAPAAPALYVPAKPQPLAVVQPPKEGLPGQPSRKPAPAHPLQSQALPSTSENLENPPKVREDDQDHRGLGTQAEAAPPQPQASPPQMPQAASDAESPPTQGPSQNLVQPPASSALANAGQKPLPQPPQSTSGASAVSANSSQAAVRPEQPWLQPPPLSAFGPPPQDLASYYYYRPPYDAYPAQYPVPYSSEPGSASLSYQDIYALYDHRYRSYDSSAPAYAENYRCSEPERPSSRASHCSDRPPARPGYPDGHYGSKSGWSSQSDYYASYYSGQYDYGDPGRWDRYYGSRFRDPRTWDRRYWYDADYDPHRKESYAYSGRPEKGDDHWRYDPRFTGSFDEDTEPHRDPYGEEADRRSEHSEHSAQSLHSAHSLHSRRSSLSSHSHQSQIYRSHNAATGSFHGDFTYGAYSSNFSGTHGFADYGYPVDAWPSAEQVPSRPTSPEKFSVPHLCARFGPGGQLIKVIPNLPSEGQPALVEIHSMEILLQHTPEQEELRTFPGPLGKDDTHKVDVINFAQNKATKCLQNDSLLDKASASLLWNFIILLCRQNGTVVGTDIAELLLRDHRTVWLPGKSPSEANLIDFTNEPVEQVEEEESGEAQLSFLMDSQVAATCTLEKETERFRELLLYGRKKDALESAMKHGLWGHALLLASKMDSRTHARVMTRFANSLPINDPLQTVYQLMSGRMPAASMCCGDEKWGDWRPHLAMVLSNLSNNVDVESRTMVTMGDTLASKGLLDAAHFCYLMAQVGFGVYTKKTTKLVLIGANHSLPFLKFATNEAIQRTEAYEYAQSLGAQTCPLPSFQVFKFIYACRLAEAGLATQAFHYCEVIAKSILTQPDAFSPVLLGQLVQMASQLRLFDPQLKEKPEEESLLEPVWLVQLRHVHRQIQEGTVPCSQDGAEPQQCPSTLGSEAEQLDGPGFSQLVGLGAEPSPLSGPEHLSPGGQPPLTASQALSGGQPPHPARVPMFPVSSPLGTLEPGPGYGPPGSALGFPELLRPDPVALYPGPGLPPGTPSLQDNGPLLLARSPDPAGTAPQESPVRNSLPEPSEEDLGNFANLEPQESQSHAVLGQGSPRTAQDLEKPPAWDSVGPGSPKPAPPLMSVSEVKRAAPAPMKETKEAKKSESWFTRWLPGKRRTEAYLPDDKNKSIVWDEKKNQWVNLNEPEEEKKAPPPPPTVFPRAPQGAPPGTGGAPAASVNVFSRKAAGGSRARYVDVLNPGGPQRSEPTLAPADFFAPLAPLPIPPNLFVPNPDAEEPQLADEAGSGGQVPAGAQADLEPTEDPKVLSSAALPPGLELLPSRLDSTQGGELSRWSSVSSLSREVGQHFQQAPSDLRAAGAPSSRGMPLYSHTQVAQASTSSGSPRPGRIGQRRHPALS